MNGEVIFFAILAMVAVVTAVGMLLSRNAVYAALFLIMNFSTVAFIYLTLGAPFIALAQITVYAGAIMVLFLFVIMLLGAEKLAAGEVLPWQRPLAIVIGVILFLEGGYLFIVRGRLTAAVQPFPDEFATPQAIGMSLFSKYLLPFEVTSVLLLVAVIGAIVLTKSEKK